MKVPLSSMNRAANRFRASYKETRERYDTSKRVLTEALRADIILDGFHLVPILTHQHRYSEMVMAVGATITGVPDESLIRQVTRHRDRLQERVMSSTRTLATAGNLNSSDALTRSIAAIRLGVEATIVAEWNDLIEFANK